MQNATLWSGVRGVEKSVVEDTGFDEAKQVLVAYVRPRQAVEALSWVRGELAMMRARALGGNARGAARLLSGGPRVRCLCRGQAVCVGPCV